VGRASIEAILLLSAEQVAGPQHKGERIADIRWHGHQKGVLPLAERKLRIDKPRLRRKGKGKNLEIPIPVYEAMQTNSQLGQRILSILMHGVSTRAYKKVLPEMAEAVGISKSNVSTIQSISRFHHRLDLVSDLFKQVIHHIGYLMLATTPNRITVGVDSLFAYYQYH